MLVFGKKISTIKSMISYQYKTRNICTWCQSIENTSNGEKMGKKYAKSGTMI
jgi:hypothetical protein